MNACWQSKFSWLQKCHSPHLILWLFPNNAEPCNADDPIDSPVGLSFASSSELSAESAWKSLYHISLSLDIFWDVLNDRSLCSWVLPAPLFFWILKFVSSSWLFPAVLSEGLVTVSLSSNDVSYNSLNWIAHFYNNDCLSLSRSGV